ncbi:response regulator [Nitrospirota bacterium]
MKELADWLKGIEHIACKAYKNASTYFQDNPELQTLLRHLSNDEAWHYHLMASASDYYSHSDVPADIKVDDETKLRIESTFTEMCSGMSKGTLTEEVMLRCVARSEYSEWNDIFLYVVHDLAGKSYEFSFGVSKIQQHMKYIEGHLSSYSQYPGLLDEFRKITHVWEKRVLIVEDTEILITLLTSILRRESLVEVARDGQEALEMIKNTSYDLVISDIQMPVMDGVELFRRVEAEHPDLIGRFIFHTSEPPPEINEIMDKYNIPCLMKPAKLSEILQAARDAIHRTSSME